MAKPSCGRPKKKALHTDVGYESEALARTFGGRFVVAGVDDPGSLNSHSGPPRLQVNLRSRAEISGAISRHSR
jgi:hypothetical protein